MRATVEKLVSFGTRHTLSSQTDPKRGIGAALDWTQGRVPAASALPTDAPVRDVHRHPRAPSDAGVRHGRDPARHRTAQRRRHHPGPHRQPRDRRDELHVRRAGRQRRRVGHCGGDRGGAGAVEAQIPRHDRLSPRCRARSRASTAARCWPITPRRRAGTSSPSSTTTSSATAAAPTACATPRMSACLSEGPRSQGQAELAAQTHSLGGENDSPSRNISRYLDSLADRLKIGLDVRQIWRTDRFGRGGDHIPFLELGFPAARLSASRSRITIGSTRICGPRRASIRRHHRQYGFRLSGQGDEAEHRRARRHRQRPAAAGAEGRGCGEHGYDGDVGRPLRAQRTTDVRWRRTDANNWEIARTVAQFQRATRRRPAHSGACRWADAKLRRLRLKSVLPHIRVDDWVFGVSSVSKDGFESPVASAVPGGAFKPYVAPPPAKEALTVTPALSRGLPSYIRKRRIPDQVRDDGSCES